MALIFNLLLLAACSTHVVGGPVPRNHQKSQFTGYFNTTSTVSSFFEQKTVQADTAIVVEPIQETVFTSIAPAITFVNPDGEPLVTQDPQTVFSTSFITPTPKPTSDKPSSALSTSPDPRQAPTGNSPLPTPSIASSALSSTVKVVENSTASGTSRQIPKFTYSPAEKETSTSVASPTDVASEVPASTSGGMPGFQHPGLVGPSQRPSNGSSSPTRVASSAVSSIVLSGSPTDSSSRSRIVVTSYTTVYASASLPDTATTEPGAPGSGSATQTQTQQQQTSSSQLPSEVTKQPSCSEDQEAAPSVTSSPAQALPEASLQVPPVVIVTSFTTVMASLEPSPIPQVPATSAVPEPVLPSSSVVSSAFETTSSLAVPTTPSPSSPESSTPAKPTSSLAPPPEPPVQPPSSTTPPASASAQPTPTPTPSPSQTPPSTSNTAPSPSAPTNVSSALSSSPPPSPEPSPSSSSISSSTTTSEGPLIITPIPPSQVFTVTETATKTEKETVRETVTVTAT